LNKSLLLISKLENEQYLEKEKVEMAAVLKEALSNFELITGPEIEHDIQIEPCCLHNNRELLEILVNNLLRNAYEHNADKGRIIVRLSETMLTVGNTGGTQKLNAEFLFERFKKGKINSRGSGLGLSIVKKICDLSGYKIEYIYINEIHQFSLFFK
jgi:signal transduction histidine kinase